MRSHPLDNKREPRMGRLALVPILAAGLFIPGAVVAHKVTEQRRMDAVEAAVLATGRSGPVHVEPLRGDECWRAREGFRWRTATEEGWACAGPKDQVTLRDAHVAEPSGMMDDE